MMIDFDVRKERHLDAVVRNDDGGDFVQVVEGARRQRLDSVVRQADVAQLTHPVGLEERAANRRQSVPFQADVAQVSHVIDGRRRHHCTIFQSILA